MVALTEGNEGEITTNGFIRDMPMEVCFGKNRLGNLGPEPSRLGRVMPSRSH